MTRRFRSLRAAAATLLVLFASACGLVLGLEDREIDPASLLPAGPAPCDDPGDCPLGGNACFVRVCVDGVCGLGDAPSGTAVLSQTPGDCRRVECDDSGEPVTIPDPTDVFDDGHPCTDDYCDGLLPKHLPTATGTECGDAKHCNGKGSCVVCLVDEECSDDGQIICDKNKCVPITCDNGEKDGFETDIDCGGPCNACKDGQECIGSSDCESLICAIGICQAASCADGKKNGGESWIDCGGPCPACGDGDPCKGPADCVSGVCSGNPPKCQPATCSDGIQNDNEIAVDCGGHCPDGSCDDGEPCKLPVDCQSGVCLQGKCQPASCDDGIKNGTEDGVDCGGPCPLCP